MTLKHGNYAFKPHEMPIMAGTPASPDHPPRRRLAYLVIGTLLSLVSGFQNGVLSAVLPQLRGDLALDLQQGGWIQAAYFTSYTCMSILFFKIRQAYGVQRFVRITLFALLVANLSQQIFRHYEVELFARVAAGIAASGLLVLSMYYLMQAFPGEKKLAGLVLGLGMMQVGTPLAQSFVPHLYGDGLLGSVFALQSALSLACIAAVLALPLPPGYHERGAFTLGDALSFSLFASGIALLCAFLVQGRIVWWTTPWLGWLLAGGVGLTGLALCLEARRHKPMLDWHWMTVPQMLIFAMMGAMARLLTSEQTVGAAGLMAVVPPQRWIIANIKETEMQHVRIGQSAHITIDALGGQLFHGTVTEIAPATASEFSLIKADSGTGNFVKIAQRIAVKITLDDGQENLPRLAPGMSAEVRIATGQ